MNWKERRRQRLPQYDYSLPGIYFITICVHDQFKRMDTFGKIKNNKINLNNPGKIVLESWTDLPSHYYIRLDEFVIMPDHVHGIILLKDIESNDCLTKSTLSLSPDIWAKKNRNGLRPFPTTASSNHKMHSISEIVRGFKSFSSRRINESNFKQYFRWQKSYYDRIIRNEKEFYAIRQYIKSNPINADLCENYIVKK